MAMNFNLESNFSPVLGFNPDSQASGKFGIIGTCWDQGGCVGPSGQRNGPEAVRKAMMHAWNRVQDGKILDVDSWRLLDLKDLAVRDFGDIDDYRVDNWVYTIDKIAENVGNLVRQGYTPVVIGGDCSIHYPAVKGIHDAVGGNVGVVYMDAHFDLWPEHPKYGKYSHASPCKNIMELERVNGENVVHFGIRSYGQPYFYEYINKHRSTPITCANFYQMGVETTAEKILGVINRNTEKSIICVDIDVLEASAAPGTASNEPGGIQSFDFQRLIQQIAPHTHGLVLTEVNKNYDVNDITAIQAAKVVNDYIFYSYADR